MSRDEDVIRTAATEISYSRFFTMAFRSKAFRSTTKNFSRDLLTVGEELTVHPVYRVWTALEVVQCTRDIISALGLFSALGGIMICVWGMSALGDVMQ